MQCNIQKQPPEKEIISNLTLVIISILITISLSEIILRSIGKRPGFIPKYNTSFIPADRLKVDTFFHTDENGVFKADPKYPWPKECTINSDGFRSIEFNYYHSSSKKILFLGDSFTWGGEAKPITNSFVDIVSKHGYLTFNTGIPTAAHNQYAYLSEKYVPLIKPDIVAIMFFMGNDIIPDEPMLPYKNLFHITNAGWIRAFDENGRYMAPQQAYEYYLLRTNLISFLPMHNPLLKAVQNICFQSVVGTYLLAGLCKIRPILRELYYKIYSYSSKSSIRENHENYNKSPSRIKAVSHVRRSLSRINSISQKYGAQCILFLIPVSPKLNDMTNSIENNYYIFEGFNPAIPNFLSKKDYIDPPDGHFNNSGHKKYAEFIIKTIKSGLQ